MMQYAHPEVLVDTSWVREHLGSRGVRLVEVDVDTKAYDSGHIPGAVGFNWQTQLQDSLRRDIIAQDAFERLMSHSRIAPEDTVVLYGDHHNWFAAYAFWLFKYYGHHDVRLMNGGRAKWLSDQHNPLSTEPPQPMPVPYRVTEFHPEIRARLPDVLDLLQTHNANLVDVRSPDEFSGKIIAPPGLNETAQRGGHIPAARNIPWSMAVNTEDGTFKSPEELRDIYLGHAAVEAQKQTIAYCRIGERSSHTWFVLTYLLGLDDVRNYDGSWTEYGNLVAVPIER